MDPSILKTGKLGRLLCGILILWVVTVSSARAQALAFFYSHGGESIIKVKDFPNTEEYKTPDGKYVDAGCKYKQFSIVFIPLWNYDVQWCGYVGRTDKYLELSKSELDALAAAAGVKLPNEPSLPFWDSWGGKLLGLVLLGFFATRGKSDS